MKYTKIIELNLSLLFNKIIKDQTKNTKFSEQENTMLNVVDYSICFRKKRSEFRRGLIEQLILHTVLP